MSMSRVCVAALAFVCATGAEALGLTAEQVVRVSQATAVIKFPSGDPAGASASAFCATRGGLFLTTARSVQGAEKAPLQLVIRAGESDQHIINATVFHVDPENNIAILQADPSQKFRALPFASQDPLFASMNVTGFGYPARRDLNPASGDATSILASSGHLASIEKQNGVAQRLLVDVAFSAGQEGGPLVNDDGNVIGIIATPGKPGSAIPVSRIHGDGAGPVLAIWPQSNPEVAIGQRQTISFSILPYTPGADYRGELAIHTSNGNRTLQGQLIEGTCEFEFAGGNLDRADEQMVAVEFDDGSIRGRVAGGTLAINGQEMPITRIRELTRRPDGSFDIRTDDHRSRVGRVTAKGTLTVRLSAVALAFDPQVAKHIVFEEPQTRRTNYIFTLKLGDDVVIQKGATLGGGSNSPAGPTSVAGVESNLPGVGQVNDLGRPTPVGNLAVMTALAGGPGGSPVDLRSTTTRDGDVMGFVYDISVWDRQPIIRRLLPLYTRSVVVAGDRAHVVTARDGYVVGGLLVDSDLYAHAFRVIFVRSNGGQLDLRDIYLSEWFGQPSSNLPPKQLAGHGEHVIGVGGRRGINMDAVALVVQP